MSSPSRLGDVGFGLEFAPAWTSTASFIHNAGATDTGTIAVDCVQLDLGRLAHQSNTGGLGLDATVQPRRSGPKQFRSIGVTVPVEITFADTGKNVYVQIEHKHRSATAGAGSTFSTIRTFERRFKNGTDSAGIYARSVSDTVNAQNIKRYYKATITFKKRMATSTAAKDTTTSTEILAGAPQYILGGARDFPAQGA